MTRCEHAQEQLLDSLYGLLEPADDDALRLHVEECASCRSLAAEAEEQRRLLARAAHICAIVPEFSAPSESIMAAEPEILPVSAPSVSTPMDLSPNVVPLQAVPAATGKRRRVRMLAVVGAAAAVLLAVAGLWGRHLSDVAEGETQLADARGKLHDIDQRITQAQQDYQRAQDTLPPQVDRGFLRVEVAGPGSMATDAPTPIRVSTRDVAGKPAPARLTIRQVANGKELHRQDVVSDGNRTITLPAGIPGMGDTKLLVEARSEDAVARLEETIRLEAPTHMAHLAVSKSMCQVGEVLFFRALVLRGFDMRVPENPVPVQFAVRDHQGKTVRQWQAETGPGGIAAGALPLTQDLISGTYTLEVTGAEAALAMRPARRQVEILRDLPPQLQFDQQEYRGGETLTAKYKGRRLPDGQAIPNADINVRITVDGKDLKVERAEQQIAAPSAPPGGAAALLRTDQAGNASFRAKLPAKIETGRALVEIQSSTGKQRDKLVQSIPVVASRLSVDFFPEGGELVAGLPNRVYYRVRTPLGEAVDPEGYVIILSSKDVILASERNQGLGVFTFTPDAGDAYTLRITTSQGVVETVNPFAKLGIRDKGVLLHVPEAVTGEGTPLHIVVRNSGATRRLLVVASCRGRIVAQDIFEATQGSHDLRLEPIAGARGVVRMTVYDAGGATLMPLAERLVYRAPAEKLAIAAQLDTKANRPGERVTIPLSANTNKGDNVRSWFLASVVNERALGVFDRSAAGPAATFYLLSGTQPQDLDNADFLVQDSAQARQALDLFLGTQGWRRFVPAEPVEPARLASRGAIDTSMTLFCRESASAEELQAKRTEALQAELGRMRRAHIRTMNSLDEERGSIVARVSLATHALVDLQARPIAFLRLGLGVLMLILIAVSIVALCVGLVRALRSAVSTSAFASAFACLLACVVIYAASGSLPDQPSAPRQIQFAELPMNRLLPEGLPQLEKTTSLAAPGTAQGLFALTSPTRQADEKLGNAEMERRPPRPSSKADIAKSDAKDATDKFTGSYYSGTKDDDHNRDDSPSARVSPLMKKRFNEIQSAQPTGPVYAATDPATFAKKGKGKIAESKHVAANLIREFKSQGDGAAPVEATLLWHPSLFAPEGKATISFDLPRVPASYRILIFGHDANGRVGQMHKTLQAR